MDAVEQVRPFVKIKMQKAENQPFAEFKYHEKTNYTVFTEPEQVIPQEHLPLKRWVNTLVCVCVCACVCMCVCISTKQPCSVDAADKRQRA